MLSCPHCQGRLDGRSQTWVCPKGCGKAVTLPVLRRTSFKDFAARLWQEIRRGDKGSGPPCPSCRKPMFRFFLPECSVELDSCRGCQVVWFDPGEHESLPLRPEVPGDEMPEEARRLLALAMVDLQREEHRQNLRTRQKQGSARDLGDMVSMFVPRSVEGVDPVRRMPWITWILSGAIVACTLLSLGDIVRVVATWGVVPAEFWRSGGMNFIGSFFLNSDAILFFESVYFLLLFGGSVEDILGRVRYGGLVLASAVTGTLFYVLFSSDPDLAYVGASGGIAGLLALHVLKFPRAKLWFSGATGWYTQPVWVWYLIWVAGHLIGEYEYLDWKIGQPTGSSVLPILGGTLVGLVFWILLDLKSEPSLVEEPQVPVPTS